MGCDIHFIVEFRNPYRGAYVPIYISDERFGDFLPGLPEEAIPNRCCVFWDQFANRNYSFFGELAGVRYDPIYGPFGTPGVPADATEHAKLAEHDGDSHSHGHCSLQTFFDAYAHGTQPEGLTTSRKLQNKPLCIQQDGFDLNFMDDYRVVYWFDN